MKKFECKNINCFAKCTLLVENEKNLAKYLIENCNHLMLCKNGVEDFHEVKEETVTDCSQLPDWCEVGKWVYDKAINRYSQVAAEDVTEGLQEMCKIISKGEIVPARKHQFDKKEMQELVGRIFTTPDGDVSIATDFDNIMNSICICSEWFKSDELANSIWQLDGKPCCKLEHQNDKGEWVE